MRAEAVTMCPNSEIMKHENFIAEYSVWYPVTSSDSASGISKGSLFVSANADITKRMKASDSGKANHIPSSCCCHTISVRVTFPAIMSTGMSDRPRATS